VIYWTGARVYRAGGKRKRALELLQRAREYALKIGASIADPAVSKRYYGLPASWQFFAAYDHGVWPEVVKLAAT
jgi:hypothetical protein